MLLSNRKRIKPAYSIYIFLCALLMQTSKASGQETAYSCSVQTTGIDLGAYNPMTRNAQTATGQLVVRCSAKDTVTNSGYNVAYAISLSKGTSDIYASRSMRFLNEYLNYNVYTTAGLHSIWGDGTEGTATLTDSYTATQSATTKYYTLVAQIFPLQNVSVGNYTDTLMVSISY